jgi:heterodisulfide reductase subunit A
VIKGKVATINEVENNDVVVRVELLDEGGRVEEHRYDLVVLAQGLVPAWHAHGVVACAEADDGFMATPEAKINPSYTTLAGVYVAGVAAGPKDIPDAIVEAGEAAMAVAGRLQRIGWHKAPAVAAVAAAAN